ARVVPRVVVVGDPLPVLVGDASPQADLLTSIVALERHDDALPGSAQNPQVEALDEARISAVRSSNAAVRRRPIARKDRGAEVEMDHVCVSERAPQERPAAQLASTWTGTGEEHLVRHVAERRRVESDNAAVESELPLGARK